MTDIEEKIIAAAARIAGAPGRFTALGIGDDTAALRIGNGRLLLFASDMMAEGTHFRREWMPPECLGWKALAANLSDIAAMGGEPRAAVVSLGLPDGLGAGFAKKIGEGMAALARRFGVDIVGGDTVRSPAVVIDVAIVGEVKERLMRRRSGAREGDIIMVTGTLGDAAAGLRALERGELKRPAWRRYLIERHLRPEPRVREGAAAARAGASAMMDLSDGLTADLPRLARASKTGAVALIDNLPVSSELPLSAGSPAAARRAALSGGEDYELLICAPEKKWEKLAERVTGETGTPVTPIGEIRAARRGLRLIDERGVERPFPKPGFSHFDGSPPARRGRAK